MLEICPELVVDGYQRMALTPIDAPTQHVPMALPTLINTALAAVLAAALYFGLRRLAALDDTAPASPFADFFADSYRRATFLGIPLLIVGAVGGTMGLGTLFRVAPELLVGSEDAFFVDMPRAAFFWAASPLALAVAAHLALAAFRGLFDFRYPDFLKTQDARTERGLRQLASRSYLLLAALSVVSVMLVSDWYTVFGEDEIRINEFWSLEDRRYGYDDIAELHYADMVWGSGWEYRDMYRLRFEDGYNLPLDPGEAFLDTKTEDLVIRNLTDKTDLDVREITFIPES